jgi:hypothetical protein
MPQPQNYGSLSCGELQFRFLIRDDKTVFVGGIVASVRLRTRQARARQVGCKTLSLPLTSVMHAKLIWDNDTTIPSTKPPSHHKMPSPKLAFAISLLAPAVYSRTIQSLLQPGDRIPGGTLFEICERFGLPDNQTDLAEIERLTVHPKYPVL